MQFNNIDESLETELKIIARLPKKIQSVYFDTQPISDTLNRKLKTYTQPFFEMRYALEHISDALMGSDGEWNTEINRTATKLARGHLVRTYTDLLDWRFRCLSKFIDNEIRFLSPDEIEKAVPEFFKEAGVASLMKQAEKKLKEAKITIDETDKRILYLDELNEICRKIFSLLENDNSLKVIRRKKISSYIFKGLIGLVSLAVIPIMVAVIIYLLGIA